MMDNSLSTQFIDMERELLGSLCLKEGLIIPKVAAILEPDDFLSPVHKLIYSSILNFNKRGIAPNMLLIFNDLKKHRDFNANEFVIKDAVFSLGEVAYTTAYAVEQAKTIKDFSNRRKLSFLAKNLQRDIDNNSIDTAQILSQTEESLRLINQHSSPPSLLSRFQYFSQLVTSDISKNKLYSNRKTGFFNIDLHQIFSPGLYVIGATPACGKTTFCWQLLEQLAANGEFCIFCSYEMSRLELYSKTLARELFLRDHSTKLTAADIRKGAYSPELEKLLLELASDKTSNAINLLELRDESIDDLLRLLKPYCNDKNKSPVVCLDYLQIVPPSDDSSSSDKARIDDIVHKLKTFQRETNTTFIVVSSFNRANYAQQVSFESFKESGNIEYTADVVWALQLNIVNNLKAANISDSRKMFDDAKKHQPREVQLKCLKNRQGQNYDCFFNYFSAHDYFAAQVDNELPTSNDNVPDVDFDDDNHND